MDSLFPHTPWNDYIKEVNLKVIELDSDRDKQYDFIMSEFHKMLADDRHFDRMYIVSWYKSQMHIIGKHHLANAFDYLTLYNANIAFDTRCLFKNITMTKTDVKKLLDEISVDVSEEKAEEIANEYNKRKEML